MCKIYTQVRKIGEYMRIRQVINFVRKLRPAKINPAEMDKIYEEASVFVEKIPKEKFNKAVESIFLTKKEPNAALSRLGELRKCAEELNCPQEIKDAISRIEKETQEFVTRAETFSTKSKYELYEENNQFYEKYRFSFDKIEEYLSNKMEATHYDEKYYHAWRVATNCHYVRPVEFKIGELPKGILPENGIVYHGTTKGRKVAKEGLSPFRSRQNMAREFGAGVYTTPDKTIASYFARIFGRIIPMKANVERTAFVESVGFGSLARESAILAQEAGIDVLKTSRLNTAIRELIMNRLFREAGYDSVYTANGMASGFFTRSIDDFIGRPQSQLVVFDPKKITLGEKKKLSQKISDELLQIKTAIKSTAQTCKTAFNDPFSIMMT